MQWIIRAGAARHGDVDMSKMYVLVEEGWEYNDEVMFRPESGGGTPTKVFASKEKAEQERDRLNAKVLSAKFADGSIQDYFYSISDMVPYSRKKDKKYQSDLDAATQKVFGMSFEDLDEKFADGNYREVKVKTEASPKDWAAFIELTNFNFWDVVEVEKG